MQSKSSRVLVTGSNKGIGYGIIETALRHSSEPGGPQYHLIMTTRDLKLGHEAINKLREKYPAAADIELVQLDIAKPDSIQRAVETLKKSGPIDILVNNAGYAGKSADPTTEELVQNTIGINYFGTRAFNDAVSKANLINENGRIINVSSLVALFSFNSKLEKSELEKLKTYKSGLSFEEFSSLAEGIFARLKKDANDESKKGSMPSIYCCSKLLLSIYTHYQGKDPEIQKKNIQVYSCHPGIVKTDMNPKGTLTYLEGADRVYHLFLLKPEIDQSKQGEYFNDDKEIESLY
jgi:NAD(P)-dependent dehydrogenase (short-subunit alcohol dehydrogenase family)